MLRYLLACGMMLFSCVISACDICGCYMGITPYRNFSTVGLFYRYRVFKGSEEFSQPNAFPAPHLRVAHGNPGDGTDNTNPNGSANGQLPTNNEIYRVYELRARYFLHKRLELNGIIPVYENTSLTSGVSRKASGMGDINLFLGYHLINKLPVDSGFRQRLVVGAGIKLRTGEYYLKDNLGERIDPLLQPGTGTNDLFVYTNYLIGFKKFGFTANILYKVNGENYYKERIGNSLTTYASLFYMIGKKKLKLIPSLQLYHEYTNGMQVRGEPVIGTKMHALMLGPGLDIFFGKFILNSSFQIPVYEQKNDGGLASAGRMVVGVSYNFVQNKHLLK